MAEVRGRGATVRVAALLCAALAAGACSTGSPRSTAAGPSATSALPATSVVAAASSGASGRSPGDPAADLAAWCRAATTSVAGTVRASGLDELSGVVVGRRDPSVRWVHNDSGDGPVLYALAPDGVLLARVEVDGVVATDWEDVAIGPGPVDGEPWLFVADIGDNNRNRPAVGVVRLVEPPLPVRRVAGQTVELVYPDGPHDAEAFFVHPVTGDWYVLTKEAGQSSVLFRAAKPGLAARRVGLEAVGYLDVRPDRVTAADLSSDGTRLAVRTYTGVRVFPVAGGDVAGALGAAPCRFNVPGELQGEAIAFEADGRSLVTVSEGDAPQLHRTG